MSFAVLFPGQLSEKAGMGEALAAAHPEVASFFEEVSRRSGVDLARTFFGAGGPGLHDDLPAQAGVFAVSVACLDVLGEAHSFFPRAAAGYSLGTYAAYVAAGVLDRWAALDVLLEARRFLAEAAPEGAMGFVIGLGAERVEEVLRGITPSAERLCIGNRNAPQQMVVTGERGPVTEALALLGKEALRAELLPIGWPMHSPSLRPVADRLAAHVERRVRLAQPGRTQLYAPALGRRVTSENEAAFVLGRQIATPSDWSSVLRAMETDGYSRFAEVGPGEVLARMLRWTLRGARAAVLEDPASIARFAGVPDPATRGEEPK